MAVTATFPGGLTGFLRYTGGTSLPSKRDVRVTGTKGRLWYTVFGGEVAVETEEGARVYPVESEIRGMKRMVRDFIGAIDEGRESDHERAGGPERPRRRTRILRVRSNGSGGKGGGPPVTEVVRAIWVPTPQIPL